MANRYWVGGTATWDTTAGTKWATSSGGAGGAAVPLSSDDVFLDGNSGAVTITVTSTRVAKSLTFTGFNGTLGGGSIDISGSIVGAASASWVSASTQKIVATGSITSNGMAIPRLSIGTVGITVDILDDLTVTTNFFVSNGTLNTNNHTISSSSMAHSGGTINMGSSTWNITEVGWTYSGGTLNPGTSTIKYTDSSNTSRTFAGGGATFYNVWFSRGTSTGTITITGANTFNDLKDDGTAAHTIVFPNATTTVTTFTVSGTSGNLITLSRTGGSGTFTLSQASGTVNSNYLSISNSDATGGATWNAGANSTDGGGNTGWIFSTPSTNSNFLAFM